MSRGLRPRIGSEMLRYAQQPATFLLLSSHCQLCLLTGTIVQLHSGRFYCVCKGRYIRTSLPMNCGRTFLYQILAAPLLKSLPFLCTCPLVYPSYGHLNP
ncbi:hypothetical protein CALVIDRAFT_142634 [Calocera viscosa TUFC12733]|uniref:Uncharacterized protein n=1 Tax=Calocera viscosa (strain TUFC12733) TaxID=1330018 RepID=A0A167LQP6_CALVF|nr:hypothetical protein CALVIDRAFT_142634 [Calocera viscosa TUFC12733]